MNGPKTWNQILWDLRDAGALNANIAGGCIRDWMLGLTPKDIDVFYQLGEGRQLGALTDRRWRDDERQYRMTDGYEGVGNIVAIFDKIFGDNTKVQLIELSREVNVLTVINGFDITLCKGRYSLVDGLVVPQQTVSDLESKTIFCENQGEGQTQARAERFLEKVSRFEEGWSIVNGRLPAPRWDPLGVGF